MQENCGAYEREKTADPSGRPNFDVKFYAITAKGEYGSATIWSNGKYSVNDGEGSRLLDCAYLYERPAKK